MLDFKKEFVSDVKVDFSTLKFYQIPFPFFAQWLNLVLEISKIMQPGFEVAIPKKQLDWYHFPDREVFEHELGGAYTLRTSSVLLQHEGHSIHLLAQYGYEAIPRQHILVKPNLSSGHLVSRNVMQSTAIDFDLQLDETLLPAVEEVFYVFQ